MLAVGGAVAAARGHATATSMAAHHAEQVAVQNWGQAVTVCRALFIGTKTLSKTAIFATTVARNHCNFVKGL